jgi:hypothetical protein
VRLPESSQGGPFRWIDDPSDIDFFFTSAKLEAKIVRRHGAIFNRTTGALDPVDLAGMHPDLQAMLNGFAGDTAQQIGRKAAVRLVRQSVIGQHPPGSVAHF